MTGVKSVPYMVLHQTVSGVEAGQDSERMILQEVLAADAGIWNFCPADLQQFPSSQGTSFGSEMQCTVPIV